MLAAPPFNYLDTLDRVDEAIEKNAELARVIVANGLRSFHMTAVDDDDDDDAPPSARREPVLHRPWQGCAKYQDIDKARSTLRQFYRDWTAAGAAERDACYGPVLRALAAARDDRAGGAAGGPEAAATTTMTKVLVPGAGLGRLVFELCMAGFEVEGNEISYHQLLASSYMLNCCERAAKHTVYPWISSFSNHATRAHHLRGYAVPDVHCATALAGPRARPGGSMTMCAADFLCLYGDAQHAGAYDAVATVFFLDTAPNLVRYLQTIRHCLRPGGLLVNVGPLLWHFENSAPGLHAHDDEGGGGATSGIADPGSFELADDEVMALVARLGFDVVTRETGIEAPYIRDAQSMLQTVYKASFWVAQKVETEPS